MLSDSGPRHFPHSPRRSATASDHFIIIPMSLQLLRHELTIRSSISAGGEAIEPVMNRPTLFALPPAIDPPTEGVPARIAGTRRRSGRSPEVGGPDVRSSRRCVRPWRPPPRNAAARGHQARVHTSRETIRSVPSEYTNVIAAFAWQAEGSPGLISAGAGEVEAAIQPLAAVGVGRNRNRQACRPGRGVGVRGSAAGRLLREGCGLHSRRIDSRSGLDGREQTSQLGRPHAGRGSRCHDQSACYPGSRKSSHRARIRRERRGPFRTDRTGSPRHGSLPRQQRAAAALAIGVGPQVVPHCLDTASLARSSRAEGLLFRVTKLIDPRIRVQRNRTVAVA